MSFLCTCFEGIRCIYSTYFKIKGWNEVWNTAEDKRGGRAVLPTARTWLHGLPCPETELVTVPGAGRLLFSSRASEPSPSKMQTSSSFPSQFSYKQSSSQHQTLKDDSWLLLTSTEQLEEPQPLTWTWASTAKRPNWGLEHTSRLSSFLLAVAAWGWGQLRYGTAA